MQKQKVHAFNNLDDHLKNDAERRFFAHDSAILAATAAINDAMERLGVTRGELAQRLGKTPGFISQVMSGNRNMTLKTLADFCYALDMQVRGIELSPLGEMQVPADVMNSWLDGYALFEVTEVSVATSEGIASANRELRADAMPCAEVSLAV